MNCGIIVAAGRSERVGKNVDKAFISLGNKPVLAYSLIAFEKCHDIDEVILVVKRDRVDAARAMAQMFGCAKVTRVIAGGVTRQQSVSNGLDALDEDARIVAVHDGARPCVTPDLISETIRVAKRNGSGVAAAKITDTIKHVERGFTVTCTVDRTKLWAVQTPQAFKIDLLKQAFSLVAKEHLKVTDEASAVEQVHTGVRLVPAPVSNIKITTADDLVLAAAILRL
jgi:2-C-methyl-D-erythritol 4-phosphate cytidylyltransferase